jgi:hypothetical protein
VNASGVSGARLLATAALLALTGCHASASGGSDLVDAGLVEDTATDAEVDQAPLREDARSERDGSMLTDSLQAWRDAWIDTRQEPELGADSVNDARAGADSARDLGRPEDVPPEVREAGVAEVRATPDVSADLGGRPDLTPAGLGPVTVVSNTVLSSNATTVKSYDTNVNISSFRQHGILYEGGYQFVAWFNGNARNAIIARRPFDPVTLAAGAWSWAYVDFTLVSDSDSHNVIVLGISPSEGRLHVAFGQHGAQLYYIRSVVDAIAAPTWDNTAFGGTGTTATGAAAPSAGLPGYSASTTEVTYPYFMNTLDGGRTLQLAYRTGSSGDGEMQLAEYDVGSGRWRYVGQFTSATGSYTQDGVTSTSRNAYPHGIGYDEGGRLHMAFTFRENLATSFIRNCSSTINNHDTLYIYSDDKGRTWKNNAGAIVADTNAGTSAGITSPGLVIDALPVGRDMMNQETQIADHQNLLHVVISYVPDPYQPGCATDRTQAQPFHLWRNAQGGWTKDQIRIDGQDVNQGYDRTKVFVDAADNLYVLLPDLRLVGATRASQWTDWKLLWDGRSLGNYGEAIIDSTLTRVASGVSVLYMKDTSSSTGELRVLDLRIGS